MKKGREKRAYSDATKEVDSQVATLKSVEMFQIRNDNMQQSNKTVGNFVVSSNEFASVMIKNGSRVI